MINLGKKNQNQTNSIRIDVFPSREKCGKTDKIYSKCNLINSYPCWYFEHVYRQYEYIDQYILLRLG